MPSIKDSTARTNALTAGEIHYMDRCDLKTLDLLKQDPNINVTEVTGYGHNIFVMNVGVAPFDNVDVRRRSNTRSTARKSSRTCFSGMARRATTIRSRSA